MLSKSLKEIKKSMLQLITKPTNASVCIELLWNKGFFKEGRALNEVSDEITSQFDNNFGSVEISKALGKASFLRCTGKRGSYRYIQRTSPVNKKIQSIEENLFSEELLKKLGKSFETEIDDLRLNFNHSGTCTAFLLRKILEKLIFKTFAKNSLSQKLEDTSGRGIGLEAMVNIACAEKIAGVPFLIPRTGEKIKGIKFLGDVSAHNPLTNVDMETIIPQMPYIITAYKELAEKL
jgi:hypothetical protein